MKLIEKIEIHRFRSISDSLINVEEINIFSGINNSGKSNILRALNLFFNGASGLNQKYDFYKDYNQAFTGQAGGKRATRIILHFNRQGEAALSKPFSIMRVFEFGRDAVTSYYSTDEKIQQKLDKNDGNINRQFTTFLNKIEYFYVPAVRDKAFVQSLFLHFEKLIEHDSGKDFEAKMGELSEILKTKSEDISADFEKFIGLPTRAALSSKTADLLGTVEINVKTGIEVVRRTKLHGKKNENVEVNLFSSGDGILMSYLAYFLAHVCKKISNKTFIWGFEEPENSLEYSKVQKIAEEFYGSFRSNAQIFITTHSPAFINLKDREGVCFYRVYIEPKDLRQASKIKTLKEIKIRQQSLFESGEIDTDEYGKLLEELYFVEFAKEIEASVERVRVEEKSLLETRQKFETKNKAFLEAHPKKIFICEDKDTRVIEFWKHLLEVFDIVDVAVMSSEGSTKNFVEIGIKHQQRLTATYSPKVFRQIDRDGLTDVQISIIEKNIFGCIDGFAYKVQFLPVNEIENFAILSNTTSFTDRFWKTNGDEIKNVFERTASDKSKSFDKQFDYKEIPFRGSSGNYTQVMQLMRKAALTDWRKYFPGKEICKKLQNFNPITFVSGLVKNDLPHELVQYMKEVKNFYEN